MGIRAFLAHEKSLKPRYHKGLVGYPYSVTPEIRLGERLWMRDFQVHSTYLVIGNMNMHVSSEKKSVSVDHKDPTVTVVWLSGAFEDLESLGQEVVDRYWQLLREARKGRAHQNIGSIGLRLRRRTNGAFSLEWYHMAYLGNTKRSIEGAYIRKGRAHHYSVDVFLRKEPDWLKVIVRDVEEALAIIRERQAFLIKMRSNLASYIGAIEGTKTCGSAMLETFRSRQQG
jgi:hypothetical protein